MFILFHSYLKRSRLLLTYARVHEQITLPNGPFYSIPHSSKWSISTTHSSKRSLSTQVQNGRFLLDSVKNGRYLLRTVQKWFGFYSAQFKIVDFYSFRLEIKQINTRKQKKINNIITRLEIETRKQKRK